MSKTRHSRVEIIQGCLVDEVLPRLMDLMAGCARLTEKQRNELRVTMNHVASLVEGNKRWIAGDRQPDAATARFRVSSHHSAIGTTRGFEDKANSTHHAWGVPLTSYVDVEENGIVEVTMRVIKKGKDSKNPWQKQSRA